MLAVREAMPRTILYLRPSRITVAPGDSSVPASILPTITALAPAARALTTSPELRVPPSAMSGTPSSRATRAHSMMAVSWGTPTPVTTRVMQMEPAPTPTFTASAPAWARSRTPSGVATLPPITGISGYCSFSQRTMPKQFSEWPWAMSTTSRSAPASTQAAARSRSTGRAPTAAPTRSRPRPSLVAWG